MKRDDGPTYEEVVQQILTTAGGPVAVDKLLDEVLARKVTASKNPRQLVRNKLREFTGRAVVYIDTDHVLAIPLTCKGARFRIDQPGDHLSRELRVFPATSVRDGKNPIGGLCRVAHPISDQGHIARGKKRGFWYVYGRKNVDGTERVVPPAEDVS